MNLIRNTLIFVVVLQLLGSLYFKLFQEEEKSPEVQLTRTIILPQSNAYTSYIDPIPKIIKSTLTTKAIPSRKIIPTKIGNSKPIKIASKTYVKNSKILSINKKIESYAKKLLGFKYVWGATGPKSFDCSGFTQKVYRKTAGIKLPRVSRNQAKIGKYIE